MTNFTTNNTLTPITDVKIEKYPNIDFKFRVEDDFYFSSDIVKIHNGVSIITMIGGFGIDNLIEIVFKIVCATGGCISAGKQEYSYYWASRTASTLTLPTYRFLNYFLSRNSRGALSQLRQTRTRPRGNR